jgi:hypothetical protein
MPAAETVAGKRTPSGSVGQNSTEPVKLRRAFRRPIVYIR